MATDSQQVQIPGYLRISKIIAYILYAWVLIGVITLTLRVFLLAFSANPSTPFVEFIYKTSADYLNPFNHYLSVHHVGLFITYQLLAVQD